MATVKEEQRKRISLFFEKMRVHLPVANRQEAVSLIKRLLTEIDDSDGVTPGDFTIRMSIPALNPELGWKNLESDPCYWDGMSHRIYLYDNGRIVIERIKIGDERLVLDKPGA